MKEIKYNINDLKNVMKKLLAEKGCDWDKAQTHDTLKKYLIEECYEAIEAINNNDMDNLCEELGDILFQVIFHSELAEKEGKFNIDNVINDITAKMIYRHPHVFTDDPTIPDWDSLKKKEKGHQSEKDIFESVPKALSTIIRAQKIISKAEKYRPSGENTDDILVEIEKCTKALKSANLNHKKELEEIIGNNLLNLIKFSQFLEINADFSLTNALETYINNVEYT